jgi:hypothetical protein
MQSTAHYTATYPKRFRKHRHQQSGSRYGAPQVPEPGAKLSKLSSFEDQ